MHGNERSEQRRQDHPGHRPRRRRRVPAGQLPPIYNALTRHEPGDQRPSRTTSSLEVAQHLGENTVRSIAHGHDRRPRPRHGRARHRRPHPHAGRPGDPRPHLQRHRRAGRRDAARSNAKTTLPIHRPAAGVRRPVDARSRCSRPASRSSTCSPRTRAAARSASSAAPASARPCSSRSSSTTSRRSTAASRCSPASASAPARATTSGSR